MAWQERAQDACKHGAVSVRLHEEWPSAWAAGNINELLIIAGLLSHTHPCIHTLTQGWDGRTIQPSKKVHFSFLFCLYVSAPSPLWSKSLPITSHPFPCHLSTLTSLSSAEKLSVLPLPHGSGSAILWRKQVSRDRGFSIPYSRHQEAGKGPPEPRNPAKQKERNKHHAENNAHSSTPTSKPLDTTQEMFRNWAFSRVRSQQDCNEAGRGPGRQSSLVASCNGQRLPVLSCWQL